MGHSTEEDDTSFPLPDLREDGQERLGKLKLPRHGKIDIRELCERAGTLRGREIQLVPMKLPDQVTGLWLSTTTGIDYIAFEKRLVPFQQMATILHEVGHALCDHEDTPVIDLNATRTLWPALSPDLVKGVLGRDHSDSPAERQAEYLGSLLAARTRWTADLTRRVSGGQEVLDLAARLSALYAPRS